MNTLRTVPTVRPPNDSHVNRLLDQAHNSLADAGRLLDAGRHAEAATRLLDAAAIATLAADELDAEGWSGG
jgi:hypothetical protein